MPSTAARPSAAGKKMGGSGASPDYGNLTRTHAEEGPAERSGRAKRSGIGGFGGSPLATTQHSTPTRRKKTKRSGESEFSGVGGFEPLL